MFFAGLLGIVTTYVMKFIPFVYVYKTPIQVASVILIAIGTYMAGAISNEEAWVARVKEMEAKVAKAEAESAKENVKIVEKVVKKLEVVRVRGDDVIKYIDREIVKYDTKFAPGGQCEIPKEFIKAINDAAEPPK
jgi:4-hydroxyphenylpyruvate dioxygenase-like putative hemolysin